MKLEECINFEKLDEIASPGSTSVSSLGTLEFNGNPANIRLYKRDKCNTPLCVAKIRRRPYEGWRLVTTEEWKNFNLPHFGNLKNIKSEINGQKHISDNIKKLLKDWGMNIEDVKQLGK